VHSTGKVHDTTLDDDKYEVHGDQKRPMGKHGTDGTQETHVMTALCNRTETFAASDLGDDQSPYLYEIDNRYVFICGSFVRKDPQEH